MPFFKKCPHDCGHSDKCHRVFFNVGSAYNSHMRSKTCHKNCNRSCPAHPNSYNKREAATLTAAEVEPLANYLWRRFKDNASAAACIPPSGLTKAEYRNARRQLLKLAEDSSDEANDSSSTENAFYMAPSPVPSHKKGKGKHSRHRRSPSPSSSEDEDDSEDSSSRAPSSPQQTKSSRSRPSRHRRDEPEPPSSKAKGKQRTVPPPPSSSEEDQEDDVESNPNPSRLPSVGPSRLASVGPSRLASVGPSRHSPEQPLFLDSPPPQLPPPTSYRSIGMVTSPPPPSLRSRASPLPPSQRSSALPPPIHHYYQSIHSNLRVISDSSFYQAEIRVVFVEDPQRRTTKETAYTQDSWMHSTALIDKAWHQKFKSAFPKLVFPKKKNDPSDYYWDWLLVVYALATKTGPAAVVLWPWERFQAAVLAGQGKDWELMENGDLVVGGINLTSDFMNPKYEGYMPAEDVAKYVRNLDRLAQRTIVWSKPDQSLEHSHKIPVLNDLASCAKHITKTWYPKFTVVADPVREAKARPGLVVKRSFSDASTHVLFDKDRQFASKMKNLEAECQKHWDHPALRTLAIQPCWFALPFIEHMQVKGEIRAYFIGGCLRYMISTCPSTKVRGNIDIGMVDAVTPLDDTKFLPIADATFLPAWKRDEAHEALKRFVTLTWQGLVEAHEKRLSPSWPSDLRIFCRLDVSLLQLPNGKMQYFVNEIATSHSAGLFLDYTDTLAPNLALDIAMVFRGWIAIHRSARAPAQASKAD